MKYTFITGMGRSGTTFMGKLLERADGLEAKHEFFGNREFMLLSHYLGKNYSTVFLEKAKNDFIATSKTNHFVDVNGYLCNATEYLPTLFDNCQIFHLVRNPKRVVPSLYMRRNDKDTHLLPEDKPAIEKWIYATKLEQICTNWVSITDKLLNEGHQLLKLEDIIQSYESLEQTFLKKANIELTRAEWSAIKSQKVNKTKSRLWRYAYARYKGKIFVEDTIPVYDNWSDIQKSILKDICGPTMVKLGYKI